ncbi:SPOR domain-containing protein [Dysgonomonas sp. 520]|uniref:SPOR domain-containing protein n=1 Tax=Dysgonomonas sp. 520 TaxID=2302931 RepID=UPI0013D5DEFD|nr:SPOR domain-containing protein [Dysgonomonas sp. 520]NDW09173.1 SPOR domain-containing protein [Dysgonomonas sp. 520]
MNKLLAIGLSLSMVVLFSACKPKQSAYKSVYEAAKERELEEEKAAEPVTKNAYPAYTPTEDATSTRVEKVKPVSDADASGLKKYSVVIASLSVKPNADILKSKIEKDGYNVILAQNESGLYRVIIASYDNKSQAVAMRNEVREEYSSKGDVSYLKRVYNIPFDDLWILERQY